MAAFEMRNSCALAGTTAQANTRAQTVLFIITPEHKTEISGVIFQQNSATRFSGQSDEVLRDCYRRELSANAKKGCIRSRRAGPQKDIRIRGEITCHRLPGT